ncbi:MAG TPA: amino acid permease [Jatrophihabitantaceae bacterium]|jgi:amino acid transporter
MTDDHGVDHRTHTARLRARAEAATSIDLPERVGYKVKRTLLGQPLVTAELHNERLSKKAALGVLSSDCISSSAYGTEEMLIWLLPIFGLSGFHILLPMTAVVIGVLVIMTLLYREVVMVYTRAGGSYVVARENFGPKIAQIASVALLIDYIVTVAVQSAAGTAAITSMIPSLRSPTVSLVLTVGVVLLLAFGNLRGIREAGKAFAFPTYFFVCSAGAVIVVGVIREIVGDLPQYGHQPGMIPITDHQNSLVSGVAIFYLLKAFANGGASLTGLEAISNGVSAFKRPEGPNARKTLTIMSIMLGTLVLGISYLSYETHATPYVDGTPTVISQVAKAAFGTQWFGHIGYVIVQIATALILYTGANTPFTGFPFLASFIAEDSFLPRQLTRRGHRLAFSNGIVVLTISALALLIGVGAHVDKLIPFYAIGVFTGFSMAGFGMAKYYRTHREGPWRRRFYISLTGGLVSVAVVLIFAVTKFTEGAWLVVVLFPILWLVLMRLNRQYRDEAHSLDLVTWIRQDQADAPHYPRHVVLVLIDRLDLAVLRGLRYAGSLRPTEIRAVHLMIDSEEAQDLERAWIDRGLGDRFPLEIVECPDRRLVRAAGELALGTVIQDRAEVTVLLPRRTFHRLSNRLLHDRTADRIAEAVGRIPHVSATIVPFDTTLPHEVVEHLEARQQEAASEPALAATRVRTGTDDDEAGVAAHHPRGDGITPIGTVAWKQRVVIEGRIKLVQVGTTAGKSLEAQVFDDTGGVRLIFFGRTRIPGIQPGTVIRAVGTVGEYKGHLALANPRYELLSSEEANEPVPSE